MKWGVRGGATPPALARRLQIASKRGEWVGLNMEIRLQHRTGTGVVERLVFEPSGIVRVVGYTLLERVPPRLRLWVEGTELEPDFLGRTHRLDLAGDLRSADEFLGWEAEFLLRDPVPAGAVRLGFDSVEVWTGKLPQTPPSAPPYAHLFDAQVPLGRDDIYGSGPPIESVPPVIGALLRDARGPLLDFGCGSGALVRHLRARGIEAEGIEIDCDGIRDVLRPDVAPHIRLYDGTLPLPYPDGAFQTACAVEVIEHIPDPGRFVSELARVTRGELLITVPDISAIPRCAPKRVVPWHLLEATHVNFFTPRSLTALLRVHFPSVEIYRIEPVDLDGVRFFTNVAARARPH